jgi:hypothetical protein
VTSRRESPRRASSSRCSCGRGKKEKVRRGRFRLLSLTFDQLLTFPILSFLRRAPPSPRSSHPCTARTASTWRCTLSGLARLAQRTPNSPSIPPPTSSSRTLFLVFSRSGSVSRLLIDDRGQRREQGTRSFPLLCCSSHPPSTSLFSLPFSSSSLSDFLALSRNSFTAENEVAAMTKARRHHCSLRAKRAREREPEENEGERTRSNIGVAGVWTKSTPVRLKGGCFNASIDGSIAVSTTEVSVRGKKGKRKKKEGTANLANEEELQRRCESRQKSSHQSRTLRRRRQLEACREVVVSRKCRGKAKTTHQVVESSAPGSTCSVQSRLSPPSTSFCCCEVRFAKGSKE